MLNLCAHEISVYELSTFDISQLKELAGRIAESHIDYIAQASPVSIANYVRKSHHFGISLGSAKGRTVDGNCRRLCDSKFWLSNLTQIADRARESIAVRSLRVGDPALGLEPYCSDESLNVYIKRQMGRSVRSLRCLQREIEKAAHSSYLMTKALCERAYAAGHLSVLITLGLDGRYHSSSPRYQGRVFDDSHAELHGVYEQLLDGLSRRGERGVDFYGARCIEVHVDGCPHWHVVLYLRPDLLPYLTERLRALHYKQSREMGAHFDNFSERIVQVKEPKSFEAYGAAVSYIFKNAYAGRAGDTCRFMAALRQKVAVSIHGKRQFDFIGASGRTVIRALRRHKTGEMAEELVVGRDQKDRKERQYAAVKNLVNGEVSKYKLVKQERVNRYGERVLKIVGVQFSKGDSTFCEAFLTRCSGVICNVSSIRVGGGCVWPWLSISLHGHLFFSRAPPNITILLRGRKLMLLKIMSKIQKTTRLLIVRTVHEACWEAPNPL